MVHCHFGPGPGMMKRDETEHPGPATPHHPQVNTHLSADSSLPPPSVWLSLSLLVRSRLTLVTADSSLRACIQSLSMLSCSSPARIARSASLTSWPMPGGHLDASAVELAVEPAVESATICWLGGRTPAQSAWASRRRGLYFTGPQSAWGIWSGGIWSGVLWAAVRARALCACWSASLAIPSSTASRHAPAQVGR